jgi:PAS domain S-box-containing protein
MPLADHDSGAGNFPAAVLILDQAGIVQATNASAATLWGAGAGQLNGESFVRLFEFEVVANDAEWLEVQWTALRETQFQRTTILQARAHDGTTRPVAVRLEPAPGLGEQLIATVTAAPPPIPIADSNDSVALLARQGAIGFFDLNPQTGTAHYSPAWKKILGYVEAELAGTYATWIDLIHPEDTAAAPDQLGRRPATAGTRPFSVEFRMRHQRGHYIWILCQGLQITNDAGAIARVVGLIVDITERKEIEEAGLVSEARLQILSDGGPLGLFELDFARGQFWYAPAFGSLLGHDPAALPAGPELFHAAIPPAEVNAGLATWWLARQPGHASWIEPVTLQRRDGTPITLLLGAQRQLTRRHDLARITGFICALPADLGNAMAGGSLPSAFAADVMAALAEAVLIADTRGRVSYLNPAAARLLRRSSEQVVGLPAHEALRLVNRQSGLPGDDVCERALAAEGTLPLCSEHAIEVGEDEAPVPIVWTARVSFGANGRAQGVVVVFRNPDEMTLSPEELLKANRFEALGLLAGGIAHDFNNLLSTILGGISLAKDNRDDSALADSEQACLTAKGLTRQLLAAAKGGTGAMTVVESPAILHDAVKIAAAGSDTKIEVHAPEDTWPVLVDRSQILQVFQNLVVNAIQAMPPPPHRGLLQLRAHNITLAEAQFASLPAGDYVEFEAQDNAAGIKPEHLEKIFDPFFTTKKHGTGLGLATVLSIVRKHGGELGVVSTVGTGTTFTVYLPRADKPAEVQARRAPSLRFGTGRVLFMDDDAKISALTATMLQSLDYKFDMAKNGEEAIKLYQRYLNIGRPYDAVIMDITVVGGMGGEECFRTLRELDPDVRAIVSSGYDNEDMARRYLDLGFCGYLTKPYRVTDLGKVLKTVLG